MRSDGNEPNDEVSDTTDDAQRTERWQLNFSVSGCLKIANRKAVCHLAILHLQTLPKGEKRETTYCFGGQSQQRKNFIV